MRSRLRQHLGLPYPYPGAWTRTGFVTSSLWSAYPTRPRKRHGIRGMLPSVLFGAILLASWWLLSVTAVVPSIALPNPVDVVQRFFAEIGRGQIFRFVWPTLTEALLGSLVAAAIAIPLAYVVSHSRLIARVIEPYVALTQTIPLVALAPILALWIGYGTVPIAILCAIIAFFPMITTSTLGFRSLDRRVVEAASLDGASGWQMLAQIEAPLAGPAVLAGLRAGLVLSITGAVVGEYMMGGKGLATWLTLQRDRADTVGMFAVLIWLSGLALCLHGIAHSAEKKLIHRLEERESR